MEFHDWTPEALIKFIGRIEKDIEAFVLNKAAVEYLCKLNDESPPTIDRLHEKLNSYKRLATHEYMREVWGSLERLRISNGIIEAEFYVPGLLVNTEVLIDKFHEEIRVTETFLAKKKNLLKISDSLKEICNEIENCISAKPITREFIPEYVGFKMLHHQGVFWGKLAGLDFEDGRDLFDRVLQDAYEMPGDNAVLERMTDWALGAQDLSIIELMMAFANKLDQEAEKKPSIKQPWRGDLELRAYLIRGLRRFFISVLNSPLDDTVALIVSAILDIDPVLDRNGVRPYLTPVPGSDI